MKRISDIKELRSFNAPGNHWVVSSCISTKAPKLIINIVEFKAVENIINMGGAAIIAVYSPDMVLLACYKDSKITEDLLDRFLHQEAVTKSIEAYTRIKNNFMGMDSTGKIFYIYAPLDKKWFKVPHTQLMEALNKVGLFFAMRIVNDKGEVIKDFTHPFLIETDEHTHAIDSFAQLLVAGLEGAIVVGGLSLIGDQF